MCSEQHKSELFPQNHRKTEIGKGLWRASSPLLKAGSTMPRCSGPFPVDSSRMETSHLLWMRTPSAWFPSQLRNYFFNVSMECLTLWLICVYFLHQQCSINIFLSYTHSVKHVEKQNLCLFPAEGLPLGKANSWFSLLLGWDDTSVTITFLSPSCSKPQGGRYLKLFRPHSAALWLKQMPKGLWHRLFQRL